MFLNSWNLVLPFGYEFETQDWGVRQWVIVFLICVYIHKEIDTNEVTGNMWTRPHVSAYSSHYMQESCLSVLQYADFATGHWVWRKRSLPVSPHIFFFFPVFFDQKIYLYETDISKCV